MRRCASEINGSLKLVWTGVDSGRPLLCPPKAEATGSNPVGRAIKIKRLSANANRRKGILGNTGVARGAQSSRCRKAHLELEARSALST